MNFICHFNIQAQNILRFFLQFFYHQILSVLTIVTSLLVPLSSLRNVLSNRGLGTYRGGAPQVISHYMCSYLLFQPIVYSGKDFPPSPFLRCFLRPPQQVYNVGFPFKKWQICIITPHIYEFHALLQLQFICLIWVSDLLLEVSQMEPPFKYWHQICHLPLSR